MTVPTFLVAGAARAGTTALVEGLRLHPDVFVTQPKEPHYFAFHGLDVACTGPGDDRWFNRVVVSDRERYLALFNDAGTASARGDGSVTTLYHADKAVPEILRANPSMRAVLILREPVERAFSSFTYLRLRGVETEVDFRRALDLEAKRRADGWHHMWHYSAMSLYADDLRTIVDGLGRSQVKVWFYDELTSNFQRVLDEVVAFIGLPASSWPHTDGAARERLRDSEIGRGAVDDRLGDENRAGPICTQTSDPLQCPGTRAIAGGTHRGRPSD
ncbi:MAG: sulfotransferase domain-containing protein [Ilumatobacteraceae bacterium]